MNDVIVLRVSAATAKITAAITNVLGIANTSRDFTCAAQITGPNRSASAHGMYGASSMPAETPVTGISDSSAAPRNRPNRKSDRLSGVENTICQVFEEKSRAAAALTNA